jgi:hypothetical protein
MKDRVGKFKAGKLLVLLVCLIVAENRGHAAELRKETLDAWNRYVAASQRRMSDRADGAAPFLWADEDPARSLRVAQGGIEVAPVSGDGSLPVPHGLIHDWVGAVFLPNASIDQVAATVRDYGRYKQYFQPNVVDSRVLEHSDREDEYAIKWVNKILFVNAGVDATCRTQFVRLGDRRLYSTSYSTSLRQVLDYGAPGERDLAPDVGSGYVWRLYAFARYEQRDGGVYVEIEALALTRDIPASLRFLVAPEVNKLSRKSLVDSLRQTRDAVQAAQPAEAIARSSSRGPTGTRLPELGADTFKQR